MLWCRARTVPWVHLGRGVEEGFSEAGGSFGVPGPGCRLRQGSRSPWGWKETALQSISREEPDSSGSEQNSGEEPAWMKGRGSWERREPSSDSNSWTLGELEGLSVRHLSLLGKEGDVGLPGRGAEKCMRPV